MITPGEFPARSYCLFFCNRNYPVRVGKVSKRRALARANAGNIPFSSRPAECHRAHGLHGDNLHTREILAQSLAYPAECAGRARSNKDPVDPVKLTRDLGRRLLRVNGLVGHILILIKPDRIRFRLQNVVDSLETRLKISTRCVALSHNNHFRAIHLHAQYVGAVHVRVCDANKLVTLDSTDHAQGYT